MQSGVAQYGWNWTAFWKLLLEPQHKHVVAEPCVQHQVIQLIYGSPCTANSFRCIVQHVFNASPNSIDESLNPQTML